MYIIYNYFITGNLGEQLPELDSLTVTRDLVGHLKNTIIAYHLVYIRGQYKVVINLDYVTLCLVLLVIVILKLLWRNLRRT